MDRQRPNLNVDVESLALIDVSAEDDDLLSSPPTKEAAYDFVGSPSTAARKSYKSFSPESTAKCLETKDASPSNEKDKQNNVAVASTEAEHPLLALQSKEDGKQNNMTAAEGEHPPLCEDDDQPKKKRRAGQYNLRKSLAWDKAFFTNEGVLNPIELSLVNKTYKKGNEALLPGIEEEESVRSSLDSNSSAKNDFSFQVLEENLFAGSYESTDSETLSAQSHSLTPSSAKFLITEKKNTVRKVAKTPDKKALYSTKESHTIRKEPQKTSQQKDISAKTALITNKRRKYVHGNDEPANETRASTQKSSLLKTNRISGRSSSPNSGKSVSSSSSTSGSAKYPASTPHSKLQREVSLVTDLKSNRVLDELPINNSEFIVASHSPSQHSILATDPSIAQDSAYLQLEKQNPLLEKTTVVDLPVNTHSGTISSSRMTSTAKGASSNSGCARPMKPSGLRMPSPKMGFFDTDKVIRQPLQRSSGTTRLLPPNIPKGPSAVHQASRLKPPGIPINNTHPSYKGAAPSSIPVATHLRSGSASLRAPYPSYKGAVPTLRPESALANTTSVPASPQSQLTPNLEHSSLASLAQQKFGYSRVREASCNQRSDEKQVPSYSRHNENILQSSFSSVSHTLEQKHNVQDISQNGSEELHTDANCKETLPAVETETSSHGDGAKVSEESMFQVAPQEISSNANSLPVNSSVQNSANPFSEEWISALENVGEEWLQMKRGPVQHSPPDKVVPQPGPWSPVRRHSQQLGPFDCTKYTNVPGNDGANQDD